MGTKNPFQTREVLRTPEDLCKQTSKNSSLEPNKNSRRSLRAKGLFYFGGHIYLIAVMHQALVDKLDNLYLHMPYIMWDDKQPMVWIPV